jgi:hypothetical protein
MMTNYVTGQELESTFNAVKNIHRGVVDVLVWYVPPACGLSAAERKALFSTPFGRID